jgi:AAA domain, putative AbiEii toxin, Type IV TA system
MLEYLHLKNVGPAPEMKMELAPRLNLITGDNGLGKSFLLDVAWWALTRRWPEDLNARLTSGYRARPSNLTEPATISFRLETKTKKSISYESTYVPRDQAWTGRQGRPWNPGLVIYAHADGGFSVWDPARNYWKTKPEQEGPERLPGYVFSAKEVWDGLTVDVHGEPTIVCNGLLRDWASWILAGGQEARNMALLLESLSPGPLSGANGEGPDQLVPGPITRLSVNDARDIPSLLTSYGATVPILHASAGVRRVTALAYMLLWSWQEHRRAVPLLGEEPTNQVVLLIDEIESHLHPRWQRSILGSVQNLMGALHEKAKIQLIAATHSPLVLASAEPEFDEEQDRLFHLRERNHKVDLHEQPWAKQGDVTNWLVSPTFGFAQGRSIEAEQAIEAAEAWMRGERQALPKGMKSRKAIHDALVRVLPGHDDFWPRWLVETKQVNGALPSRKKK